MDNKKLAISLLEAAELLNESLFNNTKKIYEVSLTGPDTTTSVFGLPSQIDEVKDYLDSKLNKNKNAYILPKTMKKDLKFFLNEYTVKKCEVSNQGNGKYHRDLYRAEKQNIIYSYTVKTFNNIIELVNFIGAKIDEVDVSEERRRIVKIVLSKLRAVKNKLHGVYIVSNTDHDIEDFINGEEDTACIGTIYLTDLYASDADEINKCVKDIDNELSNLEKIINNKKYKLYSDYDKLEGMIFIKYRH